MGLKPIIGGPGFYDRPASGGGGGGGGDMLAANNLSDLVNKPTALTNLGGTTLGINLFKIANPGAITFLRFNADNSVSSLSDSDFRTAVGAGTSSLVGSLGGNSVADSGLAALFGSDGELNATQRVIARDQNAALPGGEMNAMWLHTNREFGTGNEQYLGVGNGQYVGQLLFPTLAANRAWQVPNTSGTLALTSDIPSLSGYLLKAGDTMTGALAITQGTVNTGVLSSTGYSLTGSNATNMVDLAGTWNTSGTPTAFKLAITNTASNASSALMNLLVGATSVFKVLATGAVSLGNSTILTPLTITGLNGNLSLSFNGSSDVLWNRSFVLPAGGFIRFGFSGGTDAILTGTASALTLTQANLVLGDAINIVTNATTGSKIGTATTQKLGFWNTTPVVQPADANQAAITDSTGGTAGFTLNDVGVAFSQSAINDNLASINRQLNAFRTALVATGLIKGAA